MEFSILVVTHNHAHYLQRALRSVAAVAKDSAYEILVCDDGSTDQTAKLVKQLRGALPLRYYADDKAPTIGFARNRALKRARGTHLMFLDADDMLLPGHLTGLRSGKNPVTYGEAEGPPSHFPKLGTLLFRRELFTKSGLRFDPRLKCGEDWDLWLRLQERQIATHHVPQLVYQHFDAPEALSQQYDRAAWEAYVSARRP
jgi:glycosyltransferase involved in cell wall biosynthesis